ncbi:hypothetical protein [Bosea sp. CRIB-10]|uniref:hypothetical protein n=1 Tax=Bosea sp. CRIB-10 TaxID=378404 RepID=UPI001587605A|nr:hypothetical protein [Bosea sp. CRIB-10]
MKLDVITIVAHRAGEQARCADEFQDGARDLRSRLRNSAIFFSVINLLEFFQLPVL